MREHSRLFGRRDFLRCGGTTLGASVGYGWATTVRSCPPSRPFGRGRPLAGLVFSSAYKKHLTRAGHPESPRRLDAISGAIQRAGFGAKLARLQPRRANREEILACHTGPYYALVKREAESGAFALSTGDTMICRDSFEVALLAAGGALVAIDAVMSGRVERVFCAVRPPGHHAGPARGMGFCVFNNAAIAARYAQRRYKVARVLIADWDVHHGNGTQNIFYEDGSVFYFSTHQWPLYPGTGLRSETGKGEGAGTTLNCPFPPGSARKEILGAFQDELVPAADRFKPEIVIISAGFDSRIGDPLGGFLLTDEDFADLTDVMKRIARRHANRRIVSFLEGGYNLDGLAMATVAHVRALAAA